MPQKARFHDLVRRLLEAAGWAITHAPLYLKLGIRKAGVAEKEIVIEWHPPYQRQYTPFALV